jgi:hypothetical protein
MLAQLGRMARRDRGLTSGVIARSQRVAMTVFDTTNNSRNTATDIHSRQRYINPRPARPGFWRWDLESKRDDGIDTIERWP